MRRRVIGLNKSGQLALKSADGSEELVGNSSTGTCMLLLDCSGSMLANKKLDLAGSGALAFGLDALKRNYSVGIVQFASDAVMVTPPTTNREKLEAGLNRKAVTGSTNMAKALKLSHPILKAAEGEKVVVLVTDGMPDSPEASRAAAHGLIELNVQVIAIGTDDADWHFLRSLTTDDELATTVSSAGLAKAISSATRLLPCG